MHAICKLCKLTYICTLYKCIYTYIKMCIYFLYKYIQLYVGLYIKCVVRVCIGRERVYKYS